ncbi:site-specific integrase [Paenibacillus illinoisensis]|uniref:site-specific integrase n=1 Tax=Paenibacillus illinoisensis TaxID=59845 RepID=UPI00301C43AB
MKPKPLDNGIYELDMLKTKLDALLDQSRQYMAMSKSENTSVAYNSDFNHFRKWCEYHGLPFLPTTDEAYVMYLTDLAAAGFKVSTIKRRMTSISQAHQLKEYPSPNTIYVKTVWSGIRKMHGSAENGKKPITITLLKEMLLQVPNGKMIGYRDKSLLLMGFSGAFRRSELTNLDVEDVSVTPEGLIVRIKKSKTDQEGKGQTIGIPYGNNASTCPVRAYLSWIKQANIIKGPIFRSVNKHSQVSESRLSTKGVALIIKKYASAIGLDDFDYSGHSLRSGFATTAAMLGKSERAIKDQTRHTSDAMLRKYIRMGSIFTENAATNIGL